MEKNKNSALDEISGLISFFAEAIKTKEEQLNKVTAKMADFRSMDELMTEKDLLSEELDRVHSELQTATSLYQQLFETTHPLPIKKEIQPVAVEEQLVLSDDELTFEHISYNYTKKQMGQVLDDVSLHLKKGQLTALLGISGSGKTTLTDILIGKKQSTHPLFSLRQAGQVIDETTLHWGSVPQQNLLRENWTVSDNFDYFATIHNANSEDVNKVLQLLELSEFLDHKIKNLSGGQVRRVSIGVELIAGASFFVLDEPFSGLDIVNEVKILKMLQNYARTLQKSFVIITHNLETLASFDQLIFLSKGHKKFEGSYEDFLKLGMSSPEEADLYKNFDYLKLYQQITTEKEHVQS